MKKFVFLSALALLVGAAILRLLQHDAGYVLIVAWGKTIEMRAMVALLVLLLLAIVGAFTLRYFARSVRFVKQRWVASVDARALKNQKRIETGLLHLIEGDWLESKKILLQSVKADKNAPLPLLAAARCAHALGEHTEALGFLEKADAIQGVGSAENSGAKLALLLLKAQVLFDSHKYAPCLMVLNQAKAVAPKSSAVLILLYKTYSASQDWHALEALIPELERDKIYSNTQLLEMKQSLYFSRLGALGFELERADESAKPGLKREVDQYWSTLPKSVKQSPKFIERYCQLLVLLNEPEKAEALIRAVLKTDWSESLVLFYGVLATEDAKRQLSTASDWLSQHADDAVLQLTLGRLCVRCELWGKAREYFQASIALMPSSIAFAELARLLGYLGEAETSMDTYKKGLMQATQGLPSLPLSDTARDKEAGQQK